MWSHPGNYRLYLAHNAHYWIPLTLLIFIISIQSVSLYFVSGNITLKLFGLEMCGWHWCQQRHTNQYKHMNCVECHLFLKPSILYTNQSMIYQICMHIQPHVWQGLLHSFAFRFSWGPWLDDKLSIGFYFHLQGGNSVDVHGHAISTGHSWLVTCMTN